MLTPEQYLERERAAQDVRSEYYNGRMYAMSGGTYPHAIVVGNLARELGIALKKSSCVVTTSDMRVRVSRPVFTRTRTLSSCATCHSTGMAATTRY